MRNWFYEQMAMYSAYHRDKRNQMTHHVGVPMIVFSVMIALSQITLYTFEGGIVTLAGALITVLLLLYILAAPMVGLIALIIYSVLLYTAERIGAMGMSTAMMAFGALFIVGWIIQFWGHAYEGRKPALFDNLLQIFMAPSFLIAEVLFALGLQEHLKQEIEQRMPRYLPEGERA
ncbi:MAG: DUF962 domain-containing protein [Kordiimonadaceae bacterium]|nr:DUF962 domain-containing protein [Kordiimonadaceae bacterium]MBO6568510.1 DUF962 domain-containing protein [Kordiimonadaceae bacterium]MBO6963761.1 DUF962 domain-containing protein [Kordiimonadaceae bacterium]